jgi:hypothetical protein
LVFRHFFTIVRRGVSPRTPHPLAGVGLPESVRSHTNRIPRIQEKRRIARCHHVMHASNLNRESRFAGHVTDADRGLHGIREILAFEPQRHIDKADQDWHLHQRADHCGKGLA